MTSWSAGSKCCSAWREAGSNRLDRRRRRARPAPLVFAGPRTFTAPGLEFDCRIAAVDIGTRPALLLPPTILIEVRVTASPDYVRCSSHRLPGRLLAGIAPAILLAAILFQHPCQAAAGDAETGPRRPNILIILADDKHGQGEWNASFAREILDFLPQKRYSLSCVKLPAIPPNSVGLTTHSYT